MNKLSLGLFLLSFFLPLFLTHAQDQTVGLFQNDVRSFNGYTLFAPLHFTTTYLINNEGRLIQSWMSDFPPGSSAYLLENGVLLRGADKKYNPKFTGGLGGRIEEYDWDGNIVWSFEYADDMNQLHHDIERLPNGNILMIAWEVKLPEEAIAAGRNPDLLARSELWSEQIIEVQPTGSAGGEIVWKWHAWDHLIQDYDSTKANFDNIADHPELIDINLINQEYANRADWLHFNAIDYNPYLDQIIVSTPFLSEIWILDHSTTTKEAAGHTGGKSGKGGDILYRWGNPQNYGAGSSADRKLFFQHDAQWIEPGLPGEGNILIFNNGEESANRAYSSVDELQPPLDADGSYFREPASAFGPEQLVWSYYAENKTDFFSPFISGAQRLPNGNTLICSGMDGTFFEVSPEKEIVWKYVNSVADRGPIVQGDSIPQMNGFQINTAFRANRYPSDFSGFADKDLTPGNVIELPRSTAVTTRADIPVKFNLQQNYPNPFNAETVIRFSVSQPAKITLSIYDNLGREVALLLNNQTIQSGDHTIPFDAKLLPTGVYLYSLRTNDLVATRKMLILR